MGDEKDEMKIDGQSVEIGARLHLDWGAEGIKITEIDDKTRIFITQINDDGHRVKGGDEIKFITSADTHPTPTLDGQPLEIYCGGVPVSEDHPNDAWTASEFHATSVCDFEITEEIGLELVAEFTKPCKWTEDEDNGWHSSCGESTALIYDAPIADGFKFCPYCGKKIIEKQ